MSYIPYESQNEPEGQQSTRPDVPVASQSIPLFRKAWAVAFIGYLLLLVGLVLGAFHYELFMNSVYGGHPDVEYIEDISWMSAVESCAHFAGILLIIACIVLMTRGLLFDGGLQRYGVVLFGALSTLKWLAMAALLLYLLSLVVMALEVVVGQWMRFSIVSTTVASILLWTLPVAVAHALGRSPG